MTVDWGGYEPYQPGVHGPLHELPRAAAKQAFNRLMAERYGRIAAVARLLEQNRVAWGSSDAALAQIEAWFRAGVEADPTSRGRLRPIWYSVVNDLALFLGEVIIERAPGIHWTFFAKEARNVSFQRHVLTGFRNVPNPRYNVDIDLLLAGYAHRLVEQSDDRRDWFVTWVGAAVAKA